MVLGCVNVVCLSHWCWFGVVAVVGFVAVVGVGAYFFPGSWLVLLLLLVFGACLG